MGLLKSVLVRHINMFYISKVSVRFLLRVCLLCLVIMYFLGVHRNYWFGSVDWWFL